MTRTVKVQEFKLVEFPAGYSRAYLGNNEKQIAWVREYTMIVAKSRRRGVSFAGPDFMDGAGDLTDTFPRAALKRVFVKALDLKENEAIDDDARTHISIRRIGKSAAFEVDMPCGENACIKASVLRRLVRELENV